MYASQQKLQTTGTFVRHSKCVFSEHKLIHDCLNLDRNIYCMPFLLFFMHSIFFVCHNCGFLSQKLEFTSINHAEYLKHIGNLDDGEQGTK